MPGPELEDLLIDLSVVLPPSPEIIIVDDGNPSAMRQQLTALIARHPATLLLSLRRNGGQQRATLAGIRAARGGIIVTMDDDGGHPPRLLPRMLAMLGGAVTPGGTITPDQTPAADLVYGVPEVYGRLRRTGSVLNRSAFHLFLGVPRDVAVTSFRAFRSTLTSRFADRTPHSRCAHRPGRPAIPPNVSALLLGERPKLAVVPYAPPTSKYSRHSTRSLLTGMLLLVGWWAPLGLVQRVMHCSGRVRPREGT